MRAPALAALLALAASAPSLAAPAVPAAPAAPARPANAIEPMVVTPEQQAAAEFAFVVALMRSTVSRQCAQLPEPVHGRAVAALAGWRARNQALVEPLLSWVNYTAGIDATDATQAKEIAYGMLAGYKAKAEALARAELGTATADAAACNGALVRMEDPTRDLARSAHAPQLEAIRAYIHKLSTPGPATH